MNVMKPPQTNQSLQDVSPIDRPQRAHWEDPQLNQEQVPESQPKRLLTIEQLYVWGLRGIALLIVSSFLFVAAIYYGLINP